MRRSPRESSRERSRTRHETATHGTGEPRGTVRAGWRSLPGRWLGLAALLALLLLLRGSGAGLAPPTAGAAPFTLFSAGGPGLAAGTSLWRAAEQRTSAAWRDPSRATAFALRPPPAAGGLRGLAVLGTEFVFVLPDGSQVLGTSATLTPLLRELSALGPGDPFDASQTLCTTASRVYAQAGQVGQTGKPVDPYTEVGEAHLLLHIGQGGLIAYAGLSFLPGANVCTQPPTWEMQAGCVGTQSPADCTPPAPPAAAAQSYGSAFTAAVQSRSWSAVYALNSQLVQGQYSAASFAALMNQDAADLGRITSISAPLTTPLISFDSSGQAYFVATQNITRAADGITTTQRISSYFLLEGGAWRFWFSQAPK